MRIILAARLPHSGIRGLPSNLKADADEEAQRATPLPILRDPRGTP
jgi:hypothetical protein